MRTLALLTIAGMLAGAAGCEAPPERLAAYPSDEWLVSAYADDAVANAIIAQHTLYPYHFVANSDEMNDLGRHDLGILADHFKENPGQLNVRQGTEPKGVYAARLGAVVEFLKNADVDVARVRIANGIPGGAGMSADRIVKILGKGKIQAVTYGAAK